jgi:hypothetical protein
MQQLTIQAGSLVYYDSVTSGLVPCRVKTVDHYEIGLRVLVAVTAPRGCYSRGYEIDASTSFILPRAIGRARGSFGTRVIVPPHRFVANRGA